MLFQLMSLILSVGFFLAPQQLQIASFSVREKSKQMHRKVVHVQRWMQKMAPFFNGASRRLSFPRFK
jgi:hypothetical protein